MLKEVLTTYEVGRFCNVDLSTVANWINDGRLPAYRTPGGHRRIKKNDLLEFLKKYDMPIPRELSKSEQRVLIVDDEQMVVEVIVKSLKKMGLAVRVDTANDGFEAGQKVMAFLPDLVILDLMLPGIDGFKVCESIKNNRETKHIKILAVTGHNQNSVREKIFSCGANGYLTKPLDVVELQNSVTRLLGLTVEN